MDSNANMRASLDRRNQFNGSILIRSILDGLERRDLRRGLVTMCAAGGMAPAVIIERL
jgi:acetyl-CoA acetyltransferase